MKHHVKTSRNGDVKIDVFAKNREQNVLMDGFQKCQSGRCGCPSEAYDQIENIDIDQDADGIRLRLKPKDGAEIDTNEVEKCLDWMEGQAQER